MEIVAVGTFCFALLFSLVIQIHGAVYPCMAGNVKNGHDATKQWTMRPKLYAAEANS
jgi:hypothetical protein